MVFAYKIVYKSVNLLYYYLFHVAKKTFQHLSIITINITYILHIVESVRTSRNVKKSRF